MPVSRQTGADTHTLHTYKLRGVVLLRHDGSHHPSQGSLGQEIISRRDLPHGSQGASALSSSLRPPRQARTSPFDHHITLRKELIVVKTCLVLLSVKVGRQLAPRPAPELRRRRPDPPVLAIPTNSALISEINLRGLRDTGARKLGRARLAPPRLHLTMRLRSSLRCSLRSPLGDYGSSLISKDIAAMA